MTRVVESVVPDLGDYFTVTKVVTKTLKGARRYQELVRKIGRQLPVPSILINGKLVFETTPGPEELKDFLNTMVNHN